MNRLKSLVVSLVGVLRRAFCCFRWRRRRLSVDSDQLTDVGIIPIHHPPTHVEHDWSSWENETPDSVVTEQHLQPSTIDEHIQLYRQQKMSASLGLNVNGNEPDPDYFQDMVPKLIKQKHLLLKQPVVEEVNPDNARLKLSIQSVAMVGSGELKEWEENNTGWDDEGIDCDQTADMILREQKRLERERKAAQKLQKRMERQTRAVALGVRPS